MPRDKDGLTPKQRAFVVEYLKDFNASQAAIRAGYAPKNADVDGPRLLGNAGIAEVVERERKALEAKKFLSIERMEAELDALIHFDPATMYDEHGELLRVTDMPERTRKALVAIEQEELWEGRGEERMRTGDLRKLKWHNKRDAIELGFRRRGALVDRHEHAGPNGEPLTTTLEVRFVAPAKAGAT